jgi:hypothetical protein
MLLNLDSFSNLKGILVNVKKGLPLLLILVYRTVIILKDKLIIGKPYNAIVMERKFEPPWIK